MTLDEAIIHAEEVAEEQIKLCKRYDDASGYTRNHNEGIRTSNAKKCEKCAAEHRQLAEWLEELKQLREWTGWIPVSERLPKKSGRYIVSVLDGINRRTTVVQYQPRYKTWTMAGRMAYWKVVAWMPLPEPYKTESETKQGLNYADQDTLMPAT